MAVQSTVAAERKTSNQPPSGGWVDGLLLTLPVATACTSVAPPLCSVTVTNSSTSLADILAARSSDSLSSWLEPLGARSQAEALLLEVGCGSAWIARQVLCHGVAALGLDWKSNRLHPAAPWLPWDTASEWGIRCFLQELKFIWCPWLAVPPRGMGSEGRTIRAASALSYGAVGLASRACPRQTPLRRGSVPRNSSLRGIGETMAAGDPAGAHRRRLIRLYARFGL